MNHKCLSIYSELYFLLYAHDFICTSVKLIIENPEKKHLEIYSTLWRIRHLQTSLNSNHPMLFNIVAAKYAIAVTSPDCVPIFAAYYSKDVGFLIEK